MILYRAMRQKLPLTTTKLLRSSSTVFLGTTVVNLLNYGFSLILGHNLAPEQFGEIVTLFSIVVLLGLISLTFSIVMANYTAAYYAQQQYGQIRQLFGWLNRTALWIGIASALVFLAISPFASQWLKISLVGLILVIVAWPVQLFQAISRGVMQGHQLFVSFSLVQIIETSGKFSLGILFLMIGWSVDGVMVALLIGYVLSVIYGFWFIFKRLKLAAYPVISAQQSVGTRDLLRHISAAFWAAMLLAMLTNIDVIIVKYYAPVSLAGHYAAMSTMGKLIVFGTMAIVYAMLPIISESHSKHTNDSMTYFYMTLLLVISLCTGVILLFIIWPKQVILFSFGEDYLPVVPYLKWFSLGVSGISLGLVFVHYFLAIKVNSFVYTLFGVPITQVLFFARWHDNLQDLTRALIGISALFLAIMIGNFVWHHRLKQSIGHTLEI